MQFNILRDYQFLTKPFLWIVLESEKLVWNTQKYHA